jgi:hypothetical protein
VGWGIERQIDRPLEGFLGVLQQASVFTNG